jgi:tetratricopeptide (TPR) repeat protein
MLSIMRRLRSAWFGRRLRRQAGLDPSPESCIVLCRWLESTGRSAELFEALRRGLERFPYSPELEDLQREAWQRHGREQLHILEFRVDQQPDVAGYRELIGGYLAFGELKGAGLAAREMVRRFPIEAEASSLEGDVHLARFRRDHLSRDGQKALAAYRRSSELDPGCFAARRGLAETYSEIGATGKAIFQLLLAMDLRPNDPGLCALYESLRRLPFEHRRESDLLWEAELNDESAVRQRVEPEDPLYLKDIVQGLSRMSQLRGVRRVALSHRSLRLVAKDGRSLRVPARERDPFLSLAMGFRQSASTLAKRLGMGRFQQADLRIGPGRVLAVAAGPTVMMLAIAGEPEIDIIVREARNHIAAWTAQAYQAQEWVRA